MIKKSSIKHLRFPFSIFLLPVYLFAFSVGTNQSLENAIITFIVLHVFAYPASNGYNSYFDKDKGSIGGLKKPPKVSLNLYYVSLITDAIGNALAFLVSWKFALMVFIYGIASKAYSHPSIRLKKKPYIGWFIAGLFQGFFTFYMCYMAIYKCGFEIILSTDVAIPAILASVLLWGSYPMTQIYQHDEDMARRDITISIKLGIYGTFYFTMAMFGAASMGLIMYFFESFGLKEAIYFQLFMLPVLGYFFYWFNKVKSNVKAADFDHAMNLNWVSSSCMNTFFVLLYIIK